MEVQLLLLLHVYLLTSSFWSLSSSSAIASPPSLAKPNCPSRCGGIEIPYPFGIGPGCYRYQYEMDRGFQILCDNSTNPPRPLLNLSDSFHPEVLNISFPGIPGVLKINSPIIFSDCPNKSNYHQLPYITSQTPTPFIWSERNRLTSVSCGMMASLIFPDSVEAMIMAIVEKKKRITAVCLSICNDNSSSLVNNSCSGINCCQTSLPLSDPGFIAQVNISFTQLQLPVDSIGAFGNHNEKRCKYAFLVDQEWFNSNSTNISAIVEMDYVPVVLHWRLDAEPDNSTVDNYGKACGNLSDYCLCKKGYQGNPYFPGGCQDINECEDPTSPNICGPSGICINNNGGYECYAPQLNRSQPTYVGIIVPCSVFSLLFLIIGSWWLKKFIKKRINIKRRQKFFRLNGGLLLEQQLSSGEVNVEKIKLFNEKELDKATDRFHADRILGQGGQGTVYKGMLTDGRIVAVKRSKIDGVDKKSKTEDRREVSQFITEIVILSQINHRNVVKLLGCCLESEVPLLVYEFLPNGTLSQYIHSRDEDFPLTWEVRLRVGIEVAGAISYLHSSASNPIYHRDIKSSNILLDDKYRAKIADFGTSRSVAIDQTHLTMTHVNGTFGYLDPEYFQSSQFTDKSDVYSFGVVLAELLTGQKPVAMTRSQDGRSLATNFIVSMGEGRLFHILDAEVMKGGSKQEIVAVANLAKRCLNMKGKKRPTMKEIAAELEGILMASRSSDAQQHIAEVECVQTEIVEANWEAVSTSTGSHMDTSSSLDVQPLISFKTI